MCESEIYRRMISINHRSKTNFKEANTKESNNKIEKSLRVLQTREQGIGRWTMEGSTATFSRRKKVST